MPTIAARRLTRAVLPRRLARRQAPRVTPPTARTLPALLRAAARTEPDAQAFCYRSERLTYADWDALADRVAAGLSARGVGRGDVVALLLPSTPFYLVAYLGAARLGAVTTGINVRYRRTEIAHIVARAAPRLVLAVDGWHDTDFRAVLAGLDVPVCWLDAERLRASTRETAETFGTGAPPAAAGAPKGAWYAHASLLALAAIEARRHGSVPPPRTHLAAGISFAHVGTMARIAIQIGQRGCTIVHDAFDPAAVLAAIEAWRLEHLGAFPTQIVMLLDHPDRPRRDLSSLRSVLLGGAPSPPEL